LNTRLVVLTTALLLVAGTVLFTAMEARHAYTSRSMGGMWLEGFFQSVTARTAGFNTIDVSALQATSFVLLLLLMVVGASPLSTGGGMRTTTVAVAVLTIRSMTRNREQVEAFGRSLPLTVVHACIAIAVMYATTLFVVVSALVLTQSDVALRDAVFESVSALSTVGLSTGLTQELDTAGRWILCVAMIAGRIGPLAVLWTFVARPAPLRYRYPEEPVVIV
jgi:Trk-type K+ transport system membrane component